MTTFIMIELNYTIITESLRIKSEMGANDNLAFNFIPLYFGFSIAKSVRLESVISSKNTFLSRDILSTELLSAFKSN